MSDPPWLEFAEADYCFGKGVLRIRVDRRRVLGWEIYDGARFAVVEGVEFAWNGAVLHERRRVAIRASALAAAGLFVR